MKKIFLLSIMLIGLNTLKAQSREDKKNTMWDLINFLDENIVYSNNWSVYKGQYIGVNGSFTMYETKGLHRYPIINSRYRESNLKEFFFVLPRDMYIGIIDFLYEWENKNGPTKVSEDDTYKEFKLIKNNMRVYSIYYKHSGGDIYLDAVPVNQ